MSGWVNKFKTEIGGWGIAEANKWEIQLEPPSLLQKTGARLDSVAMAGMVIRAESVNLVGRNISSFDDSNIYGPLRQVPDGITYASDIDVSFIMSRNLFERSYFDAWQEMIFDRNTWNLGYYNDFIGRMGIYTLDREGRRTFGISCHEVWPKTIGPIALSMASTNEIIKLPVNFAFRYWTKIPEGELHTSSLVSSQAERHRNQREELIAETAGKLTAAAGAGPRFWDD